MSETFACETVEFQAGPRLDFVGEMPVPRAPRSCDPWPATPPHKPYRSRRVIISKERCRLRDKAFAVPELFRIQPEVLSGCILSVACSYQLIQQAWRCH